MAPETKPQQLTKLEIHETSGVTSPANMVGGWLVIKAEGGPPDDGAAPDAALVDALADLRDRLVEVEAKVSALPSPPAPDEVKPPSKPMPMMTPKQKLAAAEDAHRSAVLASETGTARIAASAAVLRSENRKLSEEEAIAKAVAGATGSTGIGAVIKAVAQTMIDGGMGRGEAEVAAARAVGDRLRRQLAERESGKVSKNVDPAVAEVGSMIRTSRILKGMSQAELGDRVGVSVTTISEWERGDHAPAGLNVTRLASALDGGRDMADRINAARGSR